MDTRPHDNVHMIITTFIAKLKIGYLTYFPISFERVGKVTELHICEGAFMLNRTDRDG